MESPMPRRPPPPATVSRQRSEHQSDSESGRLTLTTAAGGGGGGGMAGGHQTTPTPAVRRVTRSRGPEGSVPKRTPSRHPSPSQRKPPKTNTAAAPTGPAVRRSRHYTDPDQKAATVALKAARLVKATTSTMSATAGATSTPGTSTPGKSTGNLAMPGTASLKARGTVSGVSTPAPGLPPASSMRTSLMGSTTTTQGGSAGGVGTGLGAAPQASTVGVVNPRSPINVPPTIVAMVNAPVKMRMPPPTPVTPLTPPLEEKVAAQMVVRAEAAAWAEAAAAQLAVAEAAEAVAKGAASRAVEEQKRAAAAQAMAERRRPRVATCATAHTGPLQREQVEMGGVNLTLKSVPPAAGITARPSRGPSITSSKMSAKTTSLASKLSLSSSMGASLKTRVSSPPVTVVTTATLTASGTSETFRGEGETTTSYVVSGDSLPRGRVWEALGVEATASQRRAARRMAWAASQRKPMPKHWADLPKEVLMRIFMYFSEKELASRLSLVCRPWRQAARHPLLWRQLTFRGDRVSTVVINRLLRTSPKLQSLRLDAVPDAPTIVRQLCRCNTEVRTVIVRDCTFGKDEVVPESVFRNLIMCCPKITKLDLQGTQFSALRFFQDIIKLPSLRSLNVGDNRFLKVQDLMALSLNCQGLQQLQVARRPARPPFPQLTDNDVQYMFTHLKESLLSLAFDCAGLGDSSLRAILKCTQLKKLELNNARDFSGRELRRIGDTLRSLSKLKLTHACQMRTPDFRVLFGSMEFTTHKALDDIEAARVGEEVSPAWCMPLRGLVKVDLRSCWAMEDEGLRVVVDANRETLEFLCLKGCQTITSLGLRYVVEHCMWLRHLNVAFSLTQGSVLDPLLDAAVAMPKLRRLVVDMAHRRSPVLPRLKQQMPNLLILGSFSEYSDDESLLNFVTSLDQPPTPLTGLLTTESSTSPLTLTSASIESKEEEM